ncbi:MAG TPA: hypothetical protein VFQ36_07945 [Ktedonobacteraceae bacterium]|nr:hypothetical protein [Ktedonobacteraceae bacterium]
MSQEQNTGTPPAQGKPTTNKRSNRNGRNRPVLVTNDTNDQLSGDSMQEDAQENALNGIPVQTAIEEAPEAAPVKKRPGFFSTIGKKEEKDEAADVAAARMARATRNKTAAPVKKETKEVKATKKPEPLAVAKSAPAHAGSKPAPRRGGFKPRHLIGILAYLIVADVAGVYEKSLLVSAHAEKLLFTLGPLPIYLSTVLFLITLVVLLIVLARFDLVPRSLTPSSRQPVSGGKGSSHQNNKTSDTDSDGPKNTPNVKQGVKGENDDLYQEYRETQRYWQRRDRKK